MTATAVCTERLPEFKMNHRDIFLSYTAMMDSRGADADRAFSRGRSSFPRLISRPEVNVGAPTCAGSSHFLCRRSESELVPQVVVVSVADG